MHFIFNMAPITRKYNKTISSNLTYCQSFWNAQTQVQMKLPRVFLQVACEWQPPCSLHTRWHMC